ncbi:type IV secretion system DNA-binding domain-containing protein [Streptomyces sp. NPDC021608]|uniref:type IV secretion system DNA-binding domain-containing protein n=1 Tax=Streptomyces sp. NPDC021608 TaxID=3154903 RepID=UPI0033E26790
MMRLPSSHAAITAPLVASSTAFPGVQIGRSLLDGRPFHLSPVLAPTAILPSTNTLALGGLGSGKSTTAKTRMLREIREHGHQAVIIDSFGEDGSSGEWRPVVQALGGRVIEAGSFTLNPVSEMFPSAVREQLVRSLILAVEPGALTHQATHALQHALTHPKADHLGGLVDALVSPQDGRWPAARLTEWGEGAAIALSRYTEGSLQGIFDGEDASLPETGLPALSFDFTGLDRQSPAIPSLMAAVSCWAEHVWLPQSTARHRHFVLEEAWQILLSPATSELIQRQLKNSRKAALSLDVVMHTLSDLGDGKAQDLARLCEIAHVGRLGPEEAAAVGALLGLPQWAIDTIPGLGPGQAVWKVGPSYVDVVQTVITDEEARLTDTSSRRRAAQQPHTSDVNDDHDTEETPLPVDVEDWAEPMEDVHDSEPTPAAPALSEAPQSDDWDWDMPPNVVDARHQDVVRAAAEGRLSEASNLAAIGERDDIRRHGINSDEAVAWISTRALVAELSGDRTQAGQLRATVARMGKADWYEQTPPNDGSRRQRDDGSTPMPPPPLLPPAPAGDTPRPARRRTWPYVAAVAALSIGAAAIWQTATVDGQREDRDQKAATYKGRSGAALRMDGVDADVVAQWSTDGHLVTVELRTYFDRNVRYLRLDASGKAVQKTRGEDPYPDTPKVSFPVTDPLDDVTVRVAVGGRTWKQGVRAPSQTIRLSPTGIAYDAESGRQLPSDL